MTLSWPLFHFFYVPHLHGDLPVGLDDALPDGGQDDFSVGTDQVVMAFLHGGPDDVHVDEGLLN